MVRRARARMVAVAFVQLCPAGTSLRLLQVRPDPHWVVGMSAILQRALKRIAAIERNGVRRLRVVRHGPFVVLE